MRDASRDELFELAHECGGLFGGNIEEEDFYGDQALAAGINSAEHGTKRARADLMENPKRPECLWRKVQD